MGKVKVVCEIEFREVKNRLGVGYDDDGGVMWGWRFSWLGDRTAWQASKAEADIAGGMIRTDCKEGG